MLSFMNMGGTRKKRRRSKKGTSPSSRDNTLAVAKRASLRDSASFMSPGDLGEAKQKEDRSNLSNSTAAAPIAVRKGRPNMDKELPILITYGEQRSPEIQLEFKHDSLLNSMPGEFLRNRNRKGSLASSAEDAMPVRPPLTHVSNLCTVSSLYPGVLLVEAIGAVFMMPCLCDHRDGIAFLKLCWTLR